jgi:hypothetical protein
MWDGQVVAIFASGESMNADVAKKVQYVAALRTIAINNNFLLAPWADLLFASDARWWDIYKKKGALDFQGYKVCLEETSHAEVLVLKNTGDRGFDPNPANLRTGRNGGYQAVHLAAHTGVRKILLCGFNMQGGHWHKEHEAPLKTTPKDLYPQWIRMFAELAKELQARNIEIINCTPDSALKCVPYVDLDQALWQVSEESKPCALSA